MKLDNLIQTCSACPSQWNFVTDGDRNVYVRYRWGYLSVCLSEEPGGNAVNGIEIFGRQLGDGLHDVISWDDVWIWIKDIDIENTLASMKNNHAP